MGKKDTEKEMNQVVKTKGKWKYTRMGKIARGFLCMVTYMFFVSFAGLAGYVFYEFGTDIVLDKNYDISEANMNRISDEAEFVAECVRDITEEKNNAFRIIDADKNMVNTYDVRDIMSSETYFIDSLSSIKQYVVDSSPLDGSIYDEEYSLKLIRDKGLDLYDDCYVFFTRDSFKNIFKKNGIKNTHNWLSDGFSESAYFIYLDPEIMSSLREEEQLMNVETDPLDSNLLYTELADYKYAVYDPVQDIFYSSWDDYFTSFTHYIYKMSDITEELYSHYGAGESVSNIIFPILWSENYRDIWEFISNKYDGIDNPEYELQKRAGSAFVYYVKLYDKDGTVYSNVDSVQDILKKDNMNSYVVAGNNYKGEAANYSEDLYGYDDIVSTLDSTETGCIMYFGIDPSRLKLNDESFSASYVWIYRNIACNINYILIGVALTFILLTIQAASLIKTTGRKDKEHNEVILNWYDRFHSEVWLLIYLSLIAGSVLLSIYVMKRVSGMYFFSKYGYRSYSCDIRILINGVLSSIVFGFSFMQLTLSFARRVKAHNIKSRLLVGELYRWVLKKSGEQRIKIYVLTYILIEVLFLAYVYKKNMWYSPIFILFFVLMWIIALYAVVRVSADLKELCEHIDKTRDGDFDIEVKLQDSSSIFNDVAAGINHISDGLKMAVEKSLKDERMKTELITNVSHDLKTPLTSIINYINLLKSEKMPTPEAEHYVEVLDAKAHRLSQLTIDLVEAAKATSGNIELNMMPISFDELVKQALGEFEEKYEEKKLEAVIAYPDKKDREMYKVMADGRRLFRILDNVLQNAYKYSLENTRVYIEIINEDGQVKFIMKNISKAPLNISADELMERFTRGESSRTTEGSGLGLSIAKDLTRLMGGNFDIELDGDLFKVIITFPQLRSL